MLMWLREIFEIVGYISTAFVIGGLIWGLSLWLRGILPILLRLGNGLANRKIAILANGSNLESLKSLLVDSGTFNQKNIVCISGPQDLGRIENATVYLVHWPSWQNALEQVLAKKKDNAGLIIYAPPEGGRILNQELISINNQRNTTVTNFRGRLLSDILVSMMTTSVHNG